MPNKPLLFEFGKSGTEGINIPKSNEWNDISDSAEVLSNIKFNDDRKRVNIDVKSIPSPFARMILFKNAFTDESFPKDLKDNIFEDILDVMEFIFLHKTTEFEDKLKFVKVNLSNQNQISLNSVHRNYIKTLNDLSEIYLKEKDDKEFKKYNTIDVFYLKNGTDNYNDIIAGTSPFTVFFTPEKINVPIPGFFEYEKDRIGNKIRKHKSFNERNINFLKYLQKFYKLLPNSADNIKKEIEKRFKDFDNSSFESFRMPDTTNEIRDKDNSEVKKIEIIPDLSFEIFNDTLKLKSFYKLRPSIPFGEDTDLPLVLLGNNTEHDYYEGVKFPMNWDKVFEQAIKDDVHCERKYLPGTIKKYPWIAPMFDFFEDKLIKLPYPQSSSSMYDGENDERNNFQYLIPLKKAFFNFFKPEEIENYLSYRVINCSDNNLDSDQIEVKLKIPVEGIEGRLEHITIKKIYSGAMINYDCFEQDRKTRQVIKKGLYSALWPSILNGPGEHQIERYYIIQYEDLNPINKMWKETRFFNYKKTDNYLKLVETKNTRDNPDDLIMEMRNDSTKLFSLKYAPELIQMTRISGEQGFFIPRFDINYTNINNSTKQMFVGIDFGTSNTVVAFKENLEENDIDLLPIEEKNFRKFYGNKIEELGEKNFEKAINMFFVPMKHGVNDSDAAKGFKGKPFSTEVCYLENKERLRTPILHSNITFKREIPSDHNNQIKTNLKWATNDTRNKELIELFFNEIKSIVEKQAVEKGIPVKNIKYRYSYPLAFDPDQVQGLKNIFQDFTEFAGPLDESQCAAKYFTIEAGGFAVSNATPAITIDIGGGTSDIVGYMSNETMFKNSILLGGQDIFNDNIKNNTINNPFVLSLKKYLLTQKDDYLRFVYSDEIFGKYKDSHSLFSYIVSKDEFKKARLTLHETEFYKFFRLLILYFYAAIFYFAALNIAKNYQKIDELKSLNDISEIRIGIGGNGSKLLEWLCRNERWETYIKDNKVFSNFFRTIFFTVLKIDKEKQNNFTLTLIQSSKPKEEVVKGLLINHKDAERISHEKKNELLFGESMNISSTNINIFDDISSINRDNYAKLTYSDFNESEINKFNKLFSDTIDSFQSELSHDFKKIYLEKFKKILSSFTKDKILNATNAVIEEYFAARSDDNMIKEYNNSYFITEIKACIGLIKEELTKEEFLGNKI